MKGKQLSRGEARPYLAFYKLHLKGNYWQFANVALTPIMGLNIDWIFWKFEAGKVPEYGVIWQPPFSASMAYKPQILIYVWFCTFDGYLKVFAIHPWRTDNKIMTLAYATSAISVSYDLNMRSLRRKANIFRKSVNNKFSSSQNMPFLKIWGEWALNSCSLGWPQIKTASEL